MRIKERWKSMIAILLSCSMILPSMAVTAAPAAPAPETELITEVSQIESRENNERDTTQPAESEIHTADTELKLEADTESEMETKSKPFDRVKTAREQINFNREWKFIRNDIPGAESVDYDDSQWVDIGIPHNFSIPYEMQASFYVGYGWYRKEFEVSEAMAGKKTELEFEGVFQEAEIYVNGQPAGSHRGGYSGFVLDITDYLNPGTNLIAVRVNNIWQPDLAPRAGDHQFTGGIYRDVYLNITDDVHVTWYGTFVTTPDLSNPGFDSTAENILDSYVSEEEILHNIEQKQSNVSVSTEVKNDSLSEAAVKVKQEVVDKEGIVQAVFESAEQKIAAGSAAEITAVSEKIQNIQLWDTDNPYVYQLFTTVYRDGVPVDTYESSFGFRFAQYKNDGFYLNGKKVELNGANVHQDHAGFADAVSNEGFQRDVSMIKECGMNFIRGSHYPHDPSFAKACDDQGIMFWSECNFWGMGGCAGKDEPANGTSADWFKDAYPQNPADEAAFEQSCMDSLEAMIRVNRNHPSIINWSMGNEVFFTNGGMDNGTAASANGTAPKALALVDKMRNLSHQLDPTRKAGMGGAQRGGYADLAVCDIAGYNGDGGKFENNWMPNVVAEYGSKTADRPGEYRPFYDQIQGSDNYSYQLRPNSAGLVLWCGFHHGTIGGDGLAKMGIIDYYRLPLNSWYWYREQNLGIAPKSSISASAAQIDITSSEETITNDGTKDTQLIVTLQDTQGNWVNETKEVTLKVESGPGIFPGGKTYKFTPGKSMRDGKASIEFRSYYSGDSVISATAEGLPVSTITIHTENMFETDDGTEPEDFYRADKWGSVTAKIEDPVIYGENNAALGRPMFPSSNDRDSSLAADGNIATSWQADRTGSGEYFMVDLEFALYLYNINLGFNNAPYPYKIETAMDKNGPWTLAAEYTKETIASRKTEESLDGPEARYVKITFTDVPDKEKAFLSELNIYGNPSSITPPYTKYSAYLSDVLDYDRVTTGWGEKGKDKSCQGNQIKVGNKVYKKGIGLHADSTIIHNLDKKYTRISGVAGIDNEVDGGNAIFKIYADNSLIYEKELSGGEADEFNLSVSGVTELKLVTDANGSESQDHTDWADVKLYGAIREVSKKSTAIRTSYVGIADSLQAGEDYTGILTSKNISEDLQPLCASLSLYGPDGQLAGYTMVSHELYPKSTKDFALMLNMPSDLRGYECRLSVWDQNTLELLSNTIIIYPDPDKLESGTKTETAWTKIDGEDSSLEKVGDWQLWPSPDAYKGSETFLGDKGNPVKEGDYIALTFNGNYVKIGAKTDGGQQGADVYIDGEPAGHINNTGNANVYKEVYASGYLEDGEHTVKLVPTGKFGLDYFEYGVETVTGGSDEPLTESPILISLGGIMNKIEGDTMKNYTLSSRQSAADCIAEAYGVYINKEASEEEILAASDALENALRELLPIGDTAILEDAVQTAQTLIQKGQGNYTNASWAQLLAAYKEASAILEKADPSADEILSAADRLNHAIDSLIQKADTSPLREAVNKAKPLFDKGQGSYTDTSWAAFKTAYEEAVKVLSSAEPSAATIQSALNQLNSALAGLQLKPDTSLADARNALRAEIETCSAIVKKGQKHYTLKSFQRLKNNLSDAQKILGDSKADFNKMKSAKNLLFAARLTLTVCKLPKKGADYTVGNIKYQILKSSAENGTVCVKGVKNKKTAKLKLPNTVTISSYKFKVTEIKKKAFYKNTKIKSITISKYITKIGDAAFYGARNLKNIQIKSSKLKTVGKNAFKKIYSRAVIQVPSKKLGSYQKLFKNKGLPSKVKIKK